MDEKKLIFIAIAFYFVSNKILMIKAILIKFDLSGKKTTPVATCFIV